MVSPKSVLLSVIDYNISPLPGCDIINHRGQASRWTETADTPGENMGKQKKNYNTKKKTDKVSEKPKVDRRAKFEERVRRYAKGYTNEHIIGQIRNNCTLFGLINVLLVISFLLILSSFVSTYLDIRTFDNFWNELRLNHPVGLVFGITLLIVTYVGMLEDGWIYMFKHLRPSCSSRRYKAEEIDALANHPDTGWINELEVFVSPDALIGLNHGITVVEYADIARIRAKTIHHRQRDRRGPRGRVGFSTALYYAATDNYNEWATYLIIIETKKHKKMVLTETSYKNGADMLLPLIESKCGQIEIKR